VLYACDCGVELAVKEVRLLSSRGIGWVCVLAAWYDALRRGDTVGGPESNETVESRGEANASKCFENFGTIAMIRCRSTYYEYQPNDRARHTRREKHLRQWSYLMVSDTCRPGTQDESVLARAKSTSQTKNHLQAAKRIVPRGHVEPGAPATVCQACEVRDRKESCG